MSRFALPQGMALSCGVALSACGSSTHAIPHEAPAITSSDAGDEAPADAGSSRSVFCNRGGPSPVRDAFCADPPPTIRRLSDLRAAIGLGFGDADAVPPSGTSAGAPFVDTALLSHSTSLSSEFVSSINPRAILVGGDSILAFTRGAQQVELASADPDTLVFEFFLVKFEQACNALPGGCSAGDLFTPRIESDWTRVEIQDSEDLKNTPLDCRQCHQRGQTKPTLLMRELHAPWTHFFGPGQILASDYPAPEATGIDLMHDYVAARGNESYAGIPSNDVLKVDAIALEEAVPQKQPLVFDGEGIFKERWPAGPTGYPSAPQRSAIWYGAYDAFKRGDQLPLPYFAPRATDDAKLASLTAAYQSYREGQISADELPDLTDIRPDDPQVRAEIGLQTEPGATPAEALVQACGSCHNDVLDQTISRARFNVALSRMSRAELDTAIARLDTARDAGGAMPPLGRRQLDPDGLKPLIDYLRRDLLTAADDAFLEHAAEAGMAGGAGQ